MKKIFFLIGFIACAAVAANAQLKYEDGFLRFDFDPDAYGDVNPYANTVWRGNEHVFVGNNGGFLAIRPLRSVHMGNTNVHIGSSGYHISLTHPYTFEYQDLYLANVYTYSDALAKTDIRPVSSATGTILKLKPVTYRFAKQPEYEKSTLRPVKSDGRQVGFLAQEIMQVLPNSVAVTEDDRYVVNYISVIPILVGAIQEQNARIEALEKEITELKNR